jgi:hypothetical protein
VIELATPAVLLLLFLEPLRILLLVAAECVE